MAFRATDSAAVFNKIMPQQTPEAHVNEGFGQSEETTKKVMPEITNAKNLLSSDVEIKGSLKFQNDLTIDGKIEGEINSPGSLTVGENAEVRGEIKTKSVIVLGKVNGNITVEERCELKGRAQLIGDLKAARLVIEEGATFVGKSEVTPNKIAMKPEIVRHPDSPKAAQGGR
jgi:cytoskeletal protein CcmA (bactofilin family)